MKKIGILIFFLMGILENMPAQSPAEKKLQTAIEALKDAMIQADSIALTQLTSAMLSYGHSGGLVENKDSFIQKIMRGESNFITIQLSDQTLTIKKNMGIVRHKLDATTNDNGKKGAVHLKILQVWIREGREWKLIARQAVKI